MTPLRKRMLEELQLRNFSPSTTRGYILAVKQFAQYFGQSPEKLGAEEVRRFQLYMLKERKLSSGTVQIRMAALRFLYKKHSSVAISTSTICLFPKFLKSCRLY